MDKRDEITAARKRRRRRYRAKRLFGFVLLLALIASIAFLAGNVRPTTFRNIGDGLKTAFSSGGGFPLMIDSQRPLEAIALKNGFAVLTGSDLIVSNNRGGVLQSAAHHYSNPAVGGKGTKLIAYDRGNRAFSVYNRTGRLFSSESESPIVSADIASDGTAILLTGGERSAAELRVLSGGDYAALFTWRGAKGFPLFCEIDESGSEIRIVSLATSSNGLRSVLSVIDTASKTQRAEREIEGVILRIFRAGSGYFLVTDTGAAVLDGQLQTEAEYVFPRLPIISVSAEGGTLAVAFGDNHQPDINYVVMLSDRMQEIARIDDIGTVNDMLLTAGRLLILSEGQVHTYQIGGEPAESYQTDIKAYRVFLINGRISTLWPDRVEQPQRIETKEE